MSQAAFARALALSPSYLNQIERNQRPLTVPVLLKINAVFGVDVQRFAEDDEVRLVSDLSEVMSEQAAEAITVAELRELAASMPEVSRTIVSLHRRYREAAERAGVLAARLGNDAQSPATLMPYQEVQEHFYEHHNHFATLDATAEQTFHEAKLAVGNTREGITRRLLRRHKVRVEVRNMEAQGALRVFDPVGRTLYLSSSLEPGQQAFQLATQLGFLEVEDEITRLADSGSLSDEARGLARIGLANYFAGSLVLPYGLFLAAAEEHRYDIDLLSRRFGVGFETACHRLSTLQRPDARGVPFFFIRVDRAGNVSKRQSASDFHFSRIGGSCPLWNVYSAFSHPGETLTQLATMPDGRTYLWVARTVSRRGGGFAAPTKTFGVALGCDLADAGRLVYSDGLDLKNPRATTPIGAGCRVCERSNCPQRAFPPLARPLVIDEHSSRFAPYSAE
jgi:hypothetical protein